MKSILTNESCEKKEKPFPKLMETTTMGSVYLMASNSEGTVVHVAKNSGLALGEHRTDISGSGFRDYEGSVCLSND